MLQFHVILNVFGINYFNVLYKTEEYKNIKNF